NRKKWTLEQAAMSMAVSKSMYTKLERGERRLTDFYIDRAARAFGVSPVEVLSDEPEMSGVRRVRVKGYVQAGYWAETWEFPEDEQYEVPVPADEYLAPYALHAAETRGPSMNRRYPEGTIIVFTDANETGESISPGKRYVVVRERADGMREATV